MAENDEKAVKRVIIELEGETHVLEGEAAGQWYDMVGEAVQAFARTGRGDSIPRHFEVQVRFQKP